MDWWRKCSFYVVLSTAIKTQEEESPARNLCTAVMFSSEGIFPPFPHTVLPALALTVEMTLNLRHICGILRRLSLNTEKRLYDFICVFR